MFYNIESLVGNEDKCVLAKYREGNLMSEYTVG